MSGCRCSRSAERIIGVVQEVLEEWKNVFKKRCSNGRRCSKMPEESKVVFKERLKNRRKCSIIAGAVE